MDVLKLSKELGKAVLDSKEFQDYKYVETKVINSPNTLDLLDRFNGVQELLKEFLENGKFEEASKLKEEMNTLYDGIIENELLSQLSMKLDKVNKLRDEVFSNIDSEIKILLKSPRIKDSSSCSGCSSKSSSGCNGCS